jgi:membrane fusion protein (multidrug efflux system)
VDFIVEAFPEKMYRGKVAYVSPAVDQATRTFPVEVLVDNADRQLKPGFFAKGSVLVRLDEDVLAAPDDAISTLAGVSTVYVIEDGKARQQQVTLGAHQGKVTEIVDGLKGSESLAVTNVNQLATGTAVRVAGQGEGRGERGGQFGRARGREGANQ